MKLRTFFFESFSPLALRSRTFNTRRLYVSSLNSFERFLSRPATLADLNDETVSRYLSWFRQLPRSAHSSNKERNNLLAIWRFACRKRLIDVWPDVEPEAQPERIPQAWTKAQLAKLFEAAGEEPGIIGSVMACYWWRALLYMLWDTGERIGAIRYLEWKHVDLDGGWVTIPAELRKGGKRDAAYRLAPDTVAALRAIYRPQCDRVFPWDRNENYLWTRYVRILERAGLPSDRNSKFHRMRRSVASHFEAAGGNATELLGHSKRCVTRAYLDPKITRPPQATDLLFRPEGPDEKGGAA